MGGHRAGGELGQDRHYGEKYQIKEFDDALCTKEAAKLIASTQKKDYQSYSEFDITQQLHIDEEEIGLHPLTSHSRFRAHFTEYFYCNCFDEKTPFGNDPGTDILSFSQDYMKKKRNIDVYDYSRHIVEDDWELLYFPPDSLEPKDIKALLAWPVESLSMSQYVTITDQVINASALRQIKLMNKKFLRLKELALRSMRRLLIMAE